MKIKKILVLFMILILVSSSICFAAETYWLDLHYWTTDQTTITYWEAYEAAADQAEYYQGLCVIDQETLIDLEDQLTSSYYDLVLNSSIALGYSYMAYVDPEYLLNALTSVIDASTSIYTVYNSTIAVKNATSTYDSHLNSLKSWVSTAKGKHSSLCAYNDKWGTIHYAP